MVEKREKKNENSDEDQEILKRFVLINIKKLHPPPTIPPLPYNSLLWFILVRIYFNMSG